MANISAEALQGLAAEYMVCADLCRQGYSASLAPSGSRYDVLVDLGNRLLRVQVKSTSHQRIPSPTHKPTYLFCLTKSKKLLISPHEVDAVALVAIDIGCIAYLPASACVQNKLQIKAPGSAIHSRSKKAYTIDQLPFSKLLEEMTI